LPILAQSRYQLAAGVFGILGFVLKKELFCHKERKERIDWKSLSVIYVIFVVKYPAWPSFSWLASAELLLTG
jgi:uncharacterized membrane protein YsdA (DUF1294 family)